MLFRSATVIIAAAFCFIFVSCGGDSAANNGNISKANLSNPNLNNAPSGNNPIETTKKAVVETSNSAPTTGPIVQTYFGALKKKDDSALQSILSAQYFKTITADMKKEKKASISSYLAEYDGISDKPIEVRNEKLEGEKAVVEIRGANFLNWTPYVLVKENGAWKWTGQSPDLDSVKQGVPAHPATK